MKISVIRDDKITGKDLGYLFYYENPGKFFIEIPGHVDEWESPLILSSLVRRGIRSVDAYWSGIWVQQRIVPVDRQNLGQILRDNGLQDYNPYTLLMLGHGRCAQDSCYVKPIKEKDLPEEIKMRQIRKVDSVVPLSGEKLLIGFRDGSLQIVEKDFCTRTHRRLQAYFQAFASFPEVTVETGGAGITWGEGLTLSAEVLYHPEMQLDLKHDDLQKIVMREILTTTEACKLLGCSRQYLDELVRKKKLKPVKADVRNRLFWRSEITSFAEK